MLPIEPKSVFSTKGPFLIDKIEPCHPLGERNGSLYTKMKFSNFSFFVDFFRLTGKVFQLWVGFGYWKKLLGRVGFGFGYWYHKFNQSGIMGLDRVLGWYFPFLSYLTLGVHGSKDIKFWISERAIAGSKIPN